MRKIIFIPFLFTCFNICYSTNCDMWVYVWRFGSGCPGCTNGCLEDGYVEVWTGGTRVCYGNTESGTGILKCSNLTDGLLYDIYATGHECSDHGHTQNTFYCSSITSYMDVDVCLDGNCSTRPILIEKGENIIKIESYRLLQNYPNPFNPVTLIQYDIPKESFVTLKIYDVTGKEIQTLVNELQISGSYQVSFKAQNLPSGMYFYSITAGDFAETKKMLLVK